MPDNALLRCFRIIKSTWPMFLVAVLILSQIVYGQEEWSPQAPVSNFYFKTLFPSILFDSQHNADFIWLSRRNDPARGDILFGQFNNNLEPRMPETLLFSPFYAGLGSIDSISAAINHQDKIYVAFSAMPYDLAYGLENIYLLITDSSNNNPILRRITDSVTPSQRPAIAVFGDRVYILWSTNSNLYLTVLNQDGNRISQDILFTNIADPSTYHALTVDRYGDMHIAWESQVIPYVSRKKVNYIRVTPDLNVAVSRAISDDIPFDVYDPQIGVDASRNAHLFWNYGTRDVYYEKVDRDGQTVVNDLVVLTPDVPLASFGKPKIVVDKQGDIHLFAMYYTSSGSRNLYYTKLDNNGMTKVQPVPLLSAEDLLPNNDIWDYFTAVEEDQSYTLGGPVYITYTPYELEVQRRDLFAKKLTTFATVRGVGEQLYRGVPSEILVSDVEHPGANFIVLLTFGTSPGIPLGDGRILPANPDALTFISMLGLLGFQNSGVLDAQGHSRLSYLFSTSLPQRIHMYAVLVVFSDNAILSYSAPYGFTLY